MFCETIGCIHALNGLECFVKPSVAFNALNDSRLVKAPDIKTNNMRLADSIRDEASINIKRIERHCDKAVWMAALKLIEKKQKCKRICSFNRENHKPKRGECCM